MARALPPHLDRILRETSRSFYLTLRVAPRRVRAQLGAAYLFCRAADTIADTRLLPRDERLARLAAFRTCFSDGAPVVETLSELARDAGGHAPSAAERQLLLALPELFAFHSRFAAGDRALLARLVATLTRGMEMDLTRFPAPESGEVGALDNDAELDLYCYHVAGCVGEFWTDLAVRNLPALSSWDAPRMRELGVRFGKGLQMTNVLRDIDADLALGRLYLPRARLEPLGLTPGGLRDASSRSLLRGPVRDLLAVALEHYRAGWEYTLAVPRRLAFLRLACAWPLLIGLRTLALLAAADDPADPGAVLKVARPDVRRCLRASALRVLSDTRLDRLYRELEKPVRDAVGAERLARAGLASSTS